MRSVLIISGLTLLLATVPAVAQRGMHGGGMSRGGGRGSGMGSMRGGMGGMSGGMSDRMNGNLGGRGRDTMSQQSRGEMGRQDSGRMFEQHKGDRRERSPGESRPKGHRPTDSARSGSDMDGMNGPGGFGSLNPGSDGANSDRKPAAAPSEPQLNRNCEQVQLRPDRKVHERHQQ